MNKKIWVFKKIFIVNARNSIKIYKNKQQNPKAFLNSRMHCGKFSRWRPLIASHASIAGKKLMVSKYLIFKLSFFYGKLYKC